MKCPECKTTLHKVGVAIRALVIRNGKVLLGQRQNTGHQDGHWETPGGHYEYGENFKDSALRELKEETGLETNSDNAEFLHITNDYLPSEEKHYVSIYVKCNKTKGTAQVMEPKKCVEWKWFNITEGPNAFPKPVTQSFKNFALEYWGLQLE